MNQTAGAVVGFTVVAAATVGMWFAQRWRTGRSAQAEWAARVALANTLHKGPGGGTRRSDQKKKEACYEISAQKADQTPMLLQKWSI